MTIRSRISGKFIGRLLVGMTVSWVIAGCSATKGVYAGRSMTVIESVGKADLDSFPQPKQRLLKEANKWIGVKYRYGGTTREGVDCSGLTMQVYNKALNIKLPRNSDEQRQWCEPLLRDGMGEGDLVFFSPKGNKGGVNHVGIYLGNNKFIHASTSSGVIVSSLDDPYYNQRYHSSGRVGRYYAMIEAADARKAKELPPASVPAVTQPVNPVTVEETVAATPVTPVRKVAPTRPVPGDSIIKIARRGGVAAADTLSAEEARSRMLKRIRMKNNDLSN